MKILLIPLLLMFSTTTADAKSHGRMPSLISIGAEKIVTAVDLPNTNRFIHDGKHMDIGLIYKQLSIFFIPLLNYDKRLVSYSPSDPERYYSPDQHQLAALAASAGKKLPDTSDVSLGFWQTLGGKLIALGMIGFALRRKFNHAPIKLNPANRLQGFQRKQTTLALNRHQPNRITPRRVISRARA